MLLVRLNSLLLKYFDRLERIESFISNTIEASLGIRTFTLREIYFLLQCVNTCRMKCRMKFIY